MKIQLVMVLMIMIPYAVLAGNGVTCVSCINPGETTCYITDSTCCEFQCRSGGTIKPPVTADDCPAGTYGFNGLNCTDCPSDTVTHATTTSVSGNNSSQTDCFIPANASFYDDTGSGTYTNKCSYKML